MSRAARRNTVIALVGIVILVSLLVLNTRQATEPAQSSQTAAAQLPPNPNADYARQRVESWIAGHYGGKVQAIIRQGRSTRAQWNAAEPNNNSGVDSLPLSTPVNVAFVKGKFTVIGASGKADRYDAGRVVYDDKGFVLNFQLWDGVREVANLFSPAFDDR
jgi:hypothetical protein